MATGWIDEFLGDDMLPDDSEEEFYCPYTNSEECALITMGWQPQELCRDLECEQLKYFQRGAGRRDQAA